MALSCLPDEYTILQFAEMIRDIVNPKAKIVHLPATEDDPQRRRPWVYRKLAVSTYEMLTLVSFHRDIGRARKELTWQPRFHVRQVRFSNSSQTR
jgi:UDP-glucuronate decarboxylase